MKIVCRLELNKRKQRKWVIISVEDKSFTINDISVKAGDLVSIGEKYANKHRFNIGDTITFNGRSMIYHQFGYWIYNNIIIIEEKCSMKDIIINPISLEHDGFYLEDNLFKILYRNILKQYNTLLVGPTGSGKTSVVQLICEKLNIPCSVYDMGALHDPIAGLLGVHRLENGASIFDYAKFVSDVQKPGVIILDEFNRAPHSCMNILFPCLDDRRMLPVEIASSQGLRNAPVNAQCTFVATANIGVEYTGTLTIDKALINRFFLVEMPYLQVDIETNLLVKRTGIDRTIAKTIATIGTELRKHHQDGKIGQPISTRETIMISNLIVDGWDVLEALNICILPLYNQVDRDFVTKLILSK